MPYQYEDDELRSGPGIGGITKEKRAMTTRYGTVNGDGVRIRRTPGLSSDVLSTCGKGTRVMTNRDNDSRIRADGHWWVFVEVQNDVRTRGWMAEEYITFPYESSQDLDWDWEPYWRPITIGVVAVIAVVLMWWFFL